jgi:DNA-binding transcriptional LysR family regulator
MKIDVLGLEAFVAIAEQGAFGKAARALHISQTALTRRLQGFEALLGVELVERTTRSVALTPIGAEFLPQGRRILSELAGSMREIRESGKAQRGSVTIACVPTAGIQYLPRIIGAYSAKYPQNRIRILDHASAGVVESILRREAEFGITISGAYPPELRAEPLFKDRFVLVCRKDHPLARRSRVTWKHIEPHAVIVAGELSGNRPLVDAALSGETISIRAFYEVQRSSTAVGLVAAGVAAAVVPNLAIQRGAYPGLKVVELVDPVISRTLSLVIRRGAHLSPAAEALFSMIRSDTRVS